MSVDYRKEAEAIVEIVMPLIQGVLVKQWATALAQIEDSYKQRRIAEGVNLVIDARKIVDAANKVIQARSSLSIQKLQETLSDEGCLQLKSKIRTAERDFDEALDGLAESLEQRAKP